MKVKAEQVPRHLVWAPDGKSFYVLEKDTGVLRRIAVPGFKEVRKLDLKTPCSWMTLSAQGLVLAANATQEVYVVDAAALTVNTRSACMAARPAPGPMPYWAPPACGTRVRRRP